MHHGIPKPLDRGGPRAPSPAPIARLDAALDVIWMAPRRDR
jgi:hypothetical protein